MKSQEKSAKTEDLVFQWDRNEQVYSEQQAFSKSDKNTKRNVEDYLKFLSDMEPALNLPTRDRIANKQFTI